MTIEKKATRPRADAPAPGATLRPADPILAVEDLHVVADGGAELVRGISSRCNAEGASGSSGSPAAASR